MLSGQPWLADELHPFCMSADSETRYVEETPCGKICFGTVNTGGETSWQEREEACVMEAG